jgi:HlyD family secretion protein
VGWLRWLLLGSFVAAVVVGLRLTVLRPEPVPVTVYRVAVGRVEETVTNSRAGSVRTRRRATLSPEIGGRVAALPVRKGERVRAGQILLRVADAELRAQLALQERSLDAARASEREACQAAELAARELERSEQLAAEGLLPQGQLDQARSQKERTAAACEAARAGVGRAQAAVDLARANLDKTVLRAPFAGIVADLRTEVGEWITPAPPGVPIPPVIDLIDDAAIYVSAPLDEVDVARVRPGMPARITMDAYPGRAFLGRVVRVAPYVVDVQGQSRTFEVEVEFDDTEFARTLKPGASADVEVVLDAREGVLRVPSYALVEGRRVLIVRDQVLVEVPVETGLRNWEYTEVRRGLAPGDRVVVSLDRVDVRAGARVRVAGELGDNARER